MKTLFIGDQRLVRDVMGERLGMEPGIFIVGSIGSKDDVVSLMRNVLPDLVIVDITLNTHSCIRCVRKIRRQFTGPKIVWLMSEWASWQIDRVATIAVDGMLTTRASWDTFVLGVRQVGSGQFFYSPDIVASLQLDEAGRVICSRPTLSASQLTTRESEVLCQIASGDGQRNVASRMGISVKTVDKHVSNIMKKLSIHDRVQLARFAIREGLVEA